MNMQKNQSEVNVGIDAGKKQLDIYIRPLDIFFSVENSEKGIKDALKVLSKHSPTRIVIEATGRMEYAFVKACSKKSLPLVVANPIHIRKFGGAIGQLAKTDKLDAKLIAHYAEAIRPPLSQIKPEILQRMSDLLSRRKQLMTMQTMEKNRLQIMPKEISMLIKPVLTAVANQIDKIDKKLSKLMNECPEYKAKNEIIQSVPGVGNVVAFSLLSNMPELGYLSNKKAAALIGVAPVNKESGRFKGQRRIKGGRYQIRTVMYMAMMSAIQCNPVFKSTYERLLEAGKPKKVAIIACLRKLIIILNSMIRDGVHWNPNFAK